jgi:hypothetical protein
MTHKTFNNNKINYLERKGKGELTRLSLPNFPRGPLRGFTPLL